MPDIEDDIKREIKLSCVIDETNTGTINEEIERLHELLCLIFRYFLMKKVAFLNKIAYNLIQNI